MTQLRVWAPFARRVELWMGPFQDLPETALPMIPAGAGWYEITADGALNGRDYGFRLNGLGKVLPDPRARRQPDGVHRPSRFWVDEQYWSDGSWAGRDLAGAVLYELHVGTFTPDGTFDAVIEHLEHLVQLGVTHIELMPVNGFSGSWNWGYDGVLWFAVHERYGGPDGLHRLVDACHVRGLAVILDVVYNHFGASGNYLPNFGPYMKDTRNAWGCTVNLDGEGSAAVRDYIIENALSWFGDFHIDGLRIDAVHALEDGSPVHVLAELSARTDALALRLGRTLTLIAESDLNDPIVFTDRDRGGWGLAAAWDDDVHHGLHALLTGERQGVFADFGKLLGLTKTWTSGYLHDGSYSSFRRRLHGRPLEPDASGRSLVVCLQNHDQVGNRAGGERLDRLTSLPLLKVGAVLLLTSPFLPLLWMGEEWAASTEWRFFTSHPEPELARAVAMGRREEFKDHGWDLSQLRDPQEPSVFEAAKLRWDELERSPHDEVLRLYRDLIYLRRAIPELREGRLTDVGITYDEVQRWIVVARGGMRVVANLGGRPHRVGGGIDEPLLETAPVVRDQGGWLVSPHSAAIFRRTHRN